MAALRDLTVSSGERVELDDADRDVVLSLSWLCDPAFPWEVAHVVTRSGGRWWATDGSSAVLVPAALGADLTVTVAGDEVSRSDVIARDPAGFTGFTCGLRRWSAATVDRDDLVDAATSSAAAGRAAVTTVLERCRRRAAGTANVVVPDIAPVRLAALVAHAPEGLLTVHHRGADEPVIVLGAGGWRGVLASMRGAA